MGDSQYLQPILESYGAFRPLKTIPAFSIHLLATLVLEIMAIVFAIKHPDEQSKCKEYFVIIYAHAALWFLTLVRQFANLLKQIKVVKSTILLSSLFIFAVDKLFSKLHI